MISHGERLLCQSCPARGAQDLALEVMTRGCMQGATIPAMGCMSAAAQFTDAVPHRNEEGEPRVRGGAEAARAEKFSC